jgi:hypothetical protein
MYDMNATNLTSTKLARDQTLRNLIQKINKFPSYSGPDNGKYKPDVTNGFYTDKMIFLRALKGHEKEYLKETRLTNFSKKILSNKSKKKIIKNILLTKYKKVYDKVKDNKGENQILNFIVHKNNEGAKVHPRLERMKSIFKMGPLGRELLLDSNKTVDFDYLLNLVNGSLIKNTLNIKKDYGYENDIRNLSRKLKKNQNNLVSNTFQTKPYSEKVIHLIRNLTNISTLLESNFANNKLRDVHGIYRISKAKQMLAPRNYDTLRILIPYIRFEKKINLNYLESSYRKLVNTFDSINESIKRVFEIQRIIKTIEKLTRTRNGKIEKLTRTMNGKINMMKLKNMTPLNTQILDSIKTLTSTLTSSEKNNSENTAILRYVQRLKLNEIRYYNITNQANSARKQIKTNENMTKTTTTIFEKLQLLIDKNKRTQSELIGKFNALVDYFYDHIRKSIKIPVSVPPTPLIAS